MTHSPDNTIAAPSAEATLPASCGQERLWFLHQWEANRTAYNVPLGFDFTGPLRVEALRASCADVVRRHEILRTTFALEGGELLQVIHDDATCPFEVIDLGALATEDREARATEIARDLVSEVFPLDRGPLLRFVLLRLSDDRHRLLVNAHHIVCDGWSFEVLLREMAAFYQSHVTGVPAALEPLPIQYGDYAAWERDWLEGAECARQLEFWKERLRELPEPLVLPADHPASAQQSSAGAEIYFEFPRELTGQVEEFCRREGVTLYLVVMAAFQALLHRYSGQDKFLVGTAVANRSRVELEPLIGFFVNTVVLRADFAGEPSFRDLLARLRQEALSAFAHAELPFEKLIEQLQPERRNSRNPLFRTLLVLQEQSLAAPEFAGLNVKQRPVELGANKFDVVLELTSGKGSLRGCLTYSTELFASPTMDGLVRHFTTLLRGMLSESSSPIAAVRLLEAAERRQVLAWGQGLPGAYPETQTVHAVFEERVAASPNALAIVDGDDRLSYAELNERANRFAQYLREKGFGEGAVIGLPARQSAAFMAQIIGILKIGAAYVPLDPRDPPARSAAVRALLSGIVEEMPDLTTQPSTPPARTGDVRAAAYVMFTSGSTGEPKGVVVPHQGITRLVCATDYAPFDAQTVMSQSANLAFDGSTFEIWGALLNGGTLVITPTETALEPAAFARHLAAHQINTLFLTTSLFNQHARQSPALFSGLRCVVFGGEAADPAMVNRVLELGRPQQLVNGYGPTETTTFAVCQQIKDPAAAMPIGRPIANSDVFILDARRQLVPPGVVGEIYIGGPGVALGYLRRPELTAERFLETEYGRLYRTGDFGRWLSDGRIEYHGRIDEQFKLRGFRIEPAEIESLLREHEAVAQCAVVAKTSPAGHKVPVAYLVRKSTSPPVPDPAFRQYLVQHLPQAFVPYQWFWLESLPLTANGKLDCRALPEPSMEAGPTRAYAPAQNSVQSHLIEIWEEVFQRQPIGIRDDFFDLGGHSLLAARIVSLVSERLGYRLSFGEFFSNPTIEGHALSLTGAQSPARQAHSVAIHPQGKQTPVFFFHGDFVGGGFFCKTLARVIGEDRPFYALHPHGLQGDDVPRTIEQMATQRLQVIREIQPHGPYILGGYCNGALTAYHAARILRAWGEEVSVLLLLYADGKNIRFRWLKRLTSLSSRFRRDTEETAHQRFLRARQRFCDREDMARYYLRTVRELIKSPSREKAAPFLRKAGRLLGANANGQAAPAGAPPPPPASPLSAPYANACRAFIPERYDSRVVLLWPRDEQSQTPGGPAAGWEKICRQLEIVEVPGHHHSCIAQNSNVVLAGEAMKKAIQQAESMLKKNLK